MSSPVAGKSVASTALRPVRVIRLNPADDVVIALDQLMSGTVLDGEAVTVSGLIPPGHKVATRDIGQGEAVHRYGQIIGFASQPIRAGAARSHA
jgi:altronate hydrolase